MYKNQLQELAQRSCFNLPSYSCTRAGPDHAPRFKAKVIFNGESFESPYYFSTLRQAEHAAAEVALNTLLYRRGPTQSLAARILDETGVCKNLLQETAQRASIPLPFYTTTRSGPGHMPVFTCVVEIAGLKFYGEAAKTKKQAEKNAAMAAWSRWKQFAKQFGGGAPMLPWSEEMTEDQEQVLIARVLSLFYEKTSGISASSRAGSSSAGLSRDSSTDLGRGYSSNSQVRTGSSSTCFVTNREIAAPSREPVRINLRNVHELPAPTPREEHLRTNLRNVHEVPAPTPREEHPAAANLRADLRNVHEVPVPRNVHEVPREELANRDPPVRVNLRNTHHQVSVPVEEHQRDEDEWLRPSDKNKQQVLPTDENESKQQPRLWSRIGSDGWSLSDNSRLAGYNLRCPAPPVRVRSVIAVSSAPPQRSQSSQPRETPENDDVAGVFDRLNI